MWADDTSFGGRDSVNADLVVTEPLDATKGRATPDGNPPGVDCGHVATLG